MSETIDFRALHEQIYGDWSYSAEVDIDPARTALVIVDMQPAFIDPTVGTAKAYANSLKCGVDYFSNRVKDMVIPCHQKLLAFFREHGMFIVYIVTWSETEDLSDMPRYQQRSIRKREQAAGQQVYRKWNEGMNVCDELKPREHELVIPKRTGSAFASSTLPQVLQNAGIETVVLTGVNTNGCVFETAVVGKNMGYDFILANDATACFDPRLQDEAEMWIARHFAWVRSTAQTIELLEQALPA